MSSKDSFLARVHKQVTLGNQAGKVPPLPERNDIGYQGAGDDPVVRFCKELAAVGGFGHVAANRSEATTKILAIVNDHEAKSVLLGAGPFLDPLELLPAMQTSGCRVNVTNSVDPPSRQELFQADLGISPVDFLIAETGSILVTSKPDDPRSLSLLPPVHVAVAHASQILPDLFDLFETALQPGELPSGISLITGPSKTGDIELKLVTGVHGPGEVHVILVTS